MCEIDISHKPLMSTMPYMCLEEHFFEEGFPNIPLTWQYHPWETVLYMYPPKLFICTDKRYLILCIVAKSCNLTQYRKKNCLLHVRVFVFVDMCVCMSMCHNSASSLWSSRFPEAVAIGSCEPPDMGFKNSGPLEEQWQMVLRTELSHLSSPKDCFRKDTFASWIATQLKKYSVKVNC